MRRWLFAWAVVLMVLPGAAGAAEHVVLLADPWCPHTCAPGNSPGYMVEIATRALAKQGIAIDAWLAAHPGQVQAAGGQNALERNITKLASGRVDVVVEDDAVLAWTLNGRADKAAFRIAGRIPGGELFVAFADADGRGTRLAGLLDQGVRDLRASGELSAILGAYGLSYWKP